ncbi:MAG: hypothetical protein R6U22_04720, partial [Desulfohalobiaceae bacterium]
RTYKQSMSVYKFMHIDLVFVPGLLQTCRRNLEQARHKIQIYAQGMLQDLDPETWNAEQEDHGNESHA